MQKLEACKKRFERLIKIGTALSVEKNLEKLLEIIIEEAMRFTNAEGGTIYLESEDGKYLNFVIAQNRALGIKMGGSGAKISWPPLPLYNEDGSPNLSMVAVVSALQNRVINIEDVYEAKEFNFEGTKKFDKNTGYRSKSMLVIPMQNHEGEVIGVLQLINKKDKKGDVVSFSKEDQEMILSLASQAAVAITKNKLIQDLEKLIEGFLHSIATAIDEKSPYTGGHIRKVVKLTTMIAQAINEDEEFFKDKKYSEDDLKTLKMAALMHDIGKITTPEYIMDKATKLQSLCDRIALVKAKAEIIKRDLQIALLKKELSEQEYQKRLRQIEEALDLIEWSNLGREEVPDEVIEKLQEIAHIPLVCNGKKTTLLDEDELENLSVKKGTLTPKERQIINNHVSVTIKMLQDVPFPKKYKRVPVIAGRHHEKLNGKGYPLGLTAKDLTFEDRILAIADIFEALTSSDRPYKKPLKLSTAMKILYNMAKNGEIDKDILRFIYEKKLYLQYAKEELKPENIDDVELDFSKL